MSRLFLGMTGLLSGVFGDQVRFIPQDGAERDIQSLFREAPIEVEGADGQVVRIDAPSWRVRRDLAPEARRNDLIVVPDGRTYKVMVVHHSGSPSVDAFLICELQLSA
ncbi:hypothetical protein pben1_p42 [Paracoccus phage vB_PbeS_Pben1]|uniref:Head-tail adaptor protein n=1 Tax=Paracoccus versutus TaxID=34007 RepID=A0A3D9XRI4_PARVE|nr:hypothetical protein [Paracoccus versutus]AZV00199.1 hypothetical protein pben1_p42 [Paracoccus phage vB_PbeS_Pben1]REF72311.1 hypothetical protein BDD41_0780 [Paracoccus versutus]WGR55708.1 hypothetical protein E3U25_06950 [Paracoccus versutus]